MQRYKPLPTEADEIRRTALIGEETQRRLKAEFIERDAAKRADAARAATGRRSA